MPTPLRTRVLEILREHGYERKDEPFRLASGELSHDYVDAKRAVGDGRRLREVAEAFLEVADGTGFEAIGGLTMGADAFAHAVAVLRGCAWFSVRKEAKGHGTRAAIEGTDPGGMAVLLVDDVVTTGGSILKALDAVEDAGGRVVLASAVCDRGERTREALEARGIAYEPLVTYRDLGIDPVG